MVKHMILLACLFVALSVTTAMAHTHHTLSGVVTDAELNTPIPEVEIVLPASGNGTTTDEQGRFEIELPAGEDQNLVLSHVGYEALVIDLANQGSMNLTAEMIPAMLHGNEVQVTATRTTRSLVQVPGRAEVLSRADLMQSSQPTVDGLLKQVPGLNVHRTSGIYEVRPVISMRGVGGDDPGRTLVLIDGVPINKSDTGIANLKRVRLAEIERVEILKGAGSSLYGASAMGGVVNILTQKPREGFSGSAEINGGTYGTRNADLGIRQAFSNGISFTLSGYTGSSDGYTDIPDTLQDEYTAPLFLEEQGATARLAWETSSALEVSLEYGYDYDERGEGYRIEHEKGNHRAFDAQTLQLTVRGSLSEWRYSLMAYRQLEDYLRVSEAMKRGTYSRFDVKSQRQDDGVVGFLNRKVGRANLLSVGVDFHRGSVDGGDYYTTSPDTVLNQGTLDLTAVYVQDELSLLAGRIRALASLRLDQAHFYNGLFEANDPANAFFGYNGELDAHTWTALNPRLGLRYVHSSRFSVYSSVARGFRAAPLDDMTRTGFMRLGVNLANPELGPETLTNAEIGFDLAPTSRLSITPSLYVARGDDFLYHVATGDSLWGRRPIVQRQNVTQVDIRGVELAVAYRPLSAFTVKGHVTLNESRIAAFSDRPDLEGKDLVYSPRTQAGLRLQWQPARTSVTLDIHYKGTQFENDENTVELPAYTLMDLQVNQLLWQHLRLGVGLVNITDERHLEHLERMSPGRLAQAEIGYQW